MCFPTKCAQIPPRLHIYMGQKLQDGKKCLKCPNFTLTQRVTLSKPSILQTWVFYPAGNLCLEHPHKNFHLPGMPGNVCRKGLKFPETPGNLNWWNCNVILMTINQAYLVTFSYIPVMAPGHVSWGLLRHVTGTRHKEGLYWPRKCMN